MNRPSFLLGTVNYVSTTPRSSETQHLTKQMGCSLDSRQLYTSNESRYT